MKVKTADLIGPALNWAVATIEGYGGLRRNPHAFDQSLIMNRRDGQCVLFSSLNYLTDWSQGGPIIEREGINLFKHNKLNDGQPDVWCAHKVVPRPNMEGSFNSCALALDGPTPLIAAMRCFVSSKLGDEVDVPEELP